MNKPAPDVGRTFPMRAESVSFTNGMIVTADDLSTAMGYPIALMQTVNRAVFGCGVVCGFDIHPDPDLSKPTVECEVCVGGKMVKTKAYASTVVEVDRGVALDCSGLPVELCKPVRFDLGDERCGCDGREGEVCIYIRRINSSEAPRGDCCAPSTGGPVQCSRLQDHVEIRAFPKESEPEHACRLPSDEPGDADCHDKDEDGAPSGTHGVASEPTRRPVPGRGQESALCQCLKTCTDCDCCGDGWILLGCVYLCKSGIVAESFRGYDRHRRWIKTIACHCDRDQTKPRPDPVGLEDDEQPFRRFLGQQPGAAFQTEVNALLGDEERSATLLLTGASDWHQLSSVLEEKQDMLQQAFGLKKPDVLVGYLDKVKKKIAEERSKAADG